MEIGPVTRPGLPNVGAVSRIAPSTAAAPVKAELPRTAVEQAPSATQVQPEAKRAPTIDPDSVDRRIEIDPATQQIVYQVVDQDSGEVVRQVPEEVMLRLQAYARAMRRAAADNGEGAKVIA